MCVCDVKGSAASSLHAPPLLSCIPGWSNWRRLTLSLHPRAEMRWRHVEGKLLSLRTQHSVEYIFSISVSLARTRPHGHACSRDLEHALSCRKGDTGHQGTISDPSCRDVAIPAQATKGAGPEGPLTREMRHEGRVGDCSWRPRPGCRESPLGGHVGPAATAATVLQTPRRQGCLWTAAGRGTAFPQWCDFTLAGLASEGGWGGLGTCSSGTPPLTSSLLVLAVEASSKLWVKLRRC